MNDPMVQAIHSLLDHAAATDERLQKLIDASAAARASTAATPRRRPSASTRPRSTECLSELLGFLVD